MNISSKERQTWRLLKHNYIFSNVILDNRYPVIENCPRDQNVTTDNGNPTGTVSWTTPTVSDNDGIVNVTSTHDPGDTFDIGITTVTYTATDQSLNNVTCSFVVLVLGKTCPPEQIE